MRNFSKTESFENLRKIWLPKIVKKFLKIQNLSKEKILKKKNLKTKILEKKLKTDLKKSENRRN